MLCLDKDYLGKFGVDADSIKGYFPIGGQTATHYTIRRERGISFTSPIVDKYAPLNNLEGIGNDEIPIHELSGFDHGGAGWPGRILMMQYINKGK